MLTKSLKVKKAISFALILWLIGFVWGFIVFSVPALKNLPIDSGIAKYPMVSFPLLVVYIFLLTFMAKNYLQDVTNKIAASIKFGLILFVVNLLFDLVVYFIILKSYDYFFYFSIWFAYLLMLLVPLTIAERLRTRAKKQ